MAEYRSERTPTEFPFPAQLLTEQEEEPKGISPFGILNFVLRNITLLLVIPLLAFAVGALMSLRGEEDFVAESRFLPARGDVGGSSSGIAEELKGLIGGRRGGGSSDVVFYGSLVESAALQRKAAASEYSFETVNEEGEPVKLSGSIARIHGLSPTTPKQDVNWSLGIISGMISSSIDPGTGFVIVTTKSKWPDLAVAVNNRILELVNEFNIEQRQTQAKAERAFVEARLAEAKASLAEAEADLMAFIGNNQQFPPLSRAAIRSRQLEREVTIRQQAYTMLVGAYEQARISEVRNTPVVTVVERPEQTVRAERNEAIMRNGIFAFLVVALLMFAFVILRSYVERQARENPEDFEEFMRRVRSVVPTRFRARLPLRAAPEPRPAVAAGGVPEEDDRAW